MGHTMVSACRAKRSFWHHCVNVENKQQACRAKTHGFVSLCKSEELTAGLFGIIM